VSNFERTKLTENEIAAWWAMFGPPPVLSSENSVGYDNLRNACVAYYRPTDARHWAWIRELVDTQWEILRHLRYRTAAIEWSHKKWIHGRRTVVQQNLQKPRDEIRDLLHYVGDSQIALNRVASIKSYIANLEAGLEKLAQPDDDKHNLALQRQAKYVEKIDKWLKNATARRNNLLKILEFYCRLIDRRTEIPAAHYNELKQNELKQVTAPALGRAASVSGHVTTGHHLETVAAAAESSRNK
jgi:hypothetical protein